MSPINQRVEFGEQSPLDFNNNVHQGRIGDGEYSGEDVDSSDEEVEVDQSR